MKDNIDKMQAVSTSVPLIGSTAAEKPHNLKTQITGFVAFGVPVREAISTKSVKEIFGIILRSSKYDNQRKI